MIMSGVLFVLSAPSGAGKSTILAALKNRVGGFGYSVSHTTRDPRGREKDGVDYHFVDRMTFKEMVKAGAFVEWAKVHNNLYGTSISGIEKQTASGFDVLLDIDPQGAKNIKKKFKDSVLIYVLPPSMEILEERIRDRGTDSESIIENRMKEAPQLIEACVWYDYIIINDDLKRAVEEARAIVISERCRTIRRLPDAKKLFDISSP
jgi:guanylate kinase